MTLFNQMVRLLKKELPVPFIVDVRRIHQHNIRGGGLGECQYHPVRGKFYIRISKEISEEFAVAVLAHEWAHILASPLEGEGNIDEVHGPVFGVMWAKCHNVVTA